MYNKDNCVVEKTFNLFTAAGLISCFLNIFPLSTQPFVDIYKPPTKALIFRHDKKTVLVTKQNKSPFIPAASENLSVFILEGIPCIVFACCELLHK